MFNENSGNGLKELAECDKKEGRMQRMLSKLIELNFEFRNLRIRNLIIVFIIIFSQIFFSTLLNIVILTNGQSRLMTTIHDIFEESLELLKSRQDIGRSLLAFASFAFVDIVIIISILCACSSNGIYRKCCMYIILVYRSCSPFLYRCAIQMFLNTDKSPITIISQVLGAFLLILGIGLEILFWTISGTSQSKNINYLVFQRKKELCIKETINFLLVIIITIVVNEKETSKDIKLVLMIIHAIICFLPLYVLSSEFYYHNDQADFIFHFFCCLEFTLALMAFIEMVTGERLINENMEIMTLILSILLLWGSRQFLGFRKQAIILKNSLLLQSTNELKNFIFGVSQAIQSDVESGEKDFIMNNLKNRHREQCKDINCECHRISLNNDKYKFENFLLRKEIQQALISPFINLEIMLAICYFDLTYFKSFTDLLCQLNCFRKKYKFSIFDTFEYECFKYEIRIFLNKKKIHANAVTTERVQVQDEVLTQLGRKMHEISIRKSAFWGNLNKKQPDFEIIDSSISRQIELINEIDRSIPSLIEYFSESKTLMELISLYEVCIKMKAKMSKELRKIFKNQFLVESEKIKIMKNQKFKLENIMFDKDSVIFESCIESSNMGIIINVSKNIFNVFGHYKQSIIGHNINEIMPKSMQKEHDVILDSWRERASWANVHKIRFVFAVTKESLCFETAIYLRIMQRNDSINLLATFVKANESDYMIVNDEGVIDGIGYNFIQLLGQKAVKLPLSMICNQSRYILEKAKSNECDTICTSFYHVKELDDQIEEFLYARYNINNNLESKESEAELEKTIKNKSRSIQLTLEYKPYVMGSKCFLLLKMLEFHGHPETEKLLMSKKSRLEVESENIAYLNSSVGNNMGNNMKTSRIIAEQKEENREASFQASQTSSYRENEKIFAHLEEKFLKAGNIRSSSIRFYFIGVLAFSAISFLFLMTQYIRTNIANRQIRVEVGGAMRFVQKAEGLIMVESRLQNVDIGDGFVDKQYEMSRAFIELYKIEQSIVKENVTSWARFYKKNPSITKTMNVTRYGKQFETLFDDYYSSYMLEAIEIKRKVDENLPISRQSTDYNQKYMKTYIERCFLVLENSIKENLYFNWLFAIIKLIFMICIILIFTTLLWKSKGVEVLQKEYVMKVLLSVNDFNCQQCFGYFKSISDMLEKAISGNNKKNEAESIERIVIIESGIFSLYQNFIFEKDKFEHTKAMRRKMTKFSKTQSVVALFSLALLAGMVVLFNSENSRNEKEKEFINSYFAFITMEKEISYEFLVIKSSNMQEHLSDEELQKIETLLESRKQNKEESKLNTVFFELLGTIQRIGSDLNLPISFFNENGTLCEQIKSADRNFYNQDCLHDQNFPYSRLRYFEANSIIEEYVTNVLSMIVSKKTNGRIFEELYILEEVVTLKMLYRAVFLTEVSNWMVEFRQEKQENFMRILWILVSIVSTVVVFSLFFSMHICSEIKNNCWSILVIPEMVLRNTKGAMRYIENVLSTLQ